MVNAIAIIIKSNIIVIANNKMTMAIITIIKIMVIVIIIFINFIKFLHFPLEKIIIFIFIMGMIVIRIMERVNFLIN